jgi:hypothetical protein
MKLKTWFTGERSMFFRRCIALVLVIHLCASHSSAFHIKFHVQITDDAINQLYLTWAPSDPDLKKKLNGRWFTPGAQREIENANISLDTTDCADDPLPAAPCKFVDGSILKLLPEEKAVDWSEWASGIIVAKINEAAEHFDDELFNVSNALILDRRDEALRFMRTKDFVMARKRLGQILHTMQDFYAHSNWVELGKGRALIEPRLANPKMGRNAFTAGSPQVAGREEATCWHVEDLLLFGLSQTAGTILLTDIDDRQVQVLETKWDEYRRNLQQANAIDSPEMQALLAPMQRIMTILRNRPKEGRLTSGYFPNSHEAINQYRKCAHGLGYTASDLNKNLPEATIIMRGINKDWPYAQDDPLSFERHSVAKYLATQHSRMFISDLLNEGCGSDIDCLVGFLGGSDVKPENDCPGAVTEHQHNSALIDINADRWNDTGLTVQAGEKINIKVLDGQIVWRKPLFLQTAPAQAPTGTIIERTLSSVIGRGDTARPDGDTSVIPWNTQPWVPPQIAIEKAPIGSVIGMIIPPGTTGKLTEKPSGATFFEVLGGSDQQPFTMPAGGYLFLGINDGEFFNNAGCFQASVKRASP